MRRGLVAVAAGLVLLTVLAFGGVVRNEFIALDDQAYLVENAMVNDGLTARGLAWAFTTTRAANWHPLAWISHMLDVQLFGMRAGYHHLVSLVLHVVNALLLLALLHRLTGALWRSALVAALFAVHPLHVESVAWALERKDVLSSAFALLTLLAYLGWTRRRTAMRQAAVAALFALALMAKPTPVTLPFALLLLDWWPLGRWRPADSCAGFLPPRGLWIEKIPLLLLSAAAGLVTVIAQTAEGAVAGTTALPLSVRAANAAVSYVRYLGRTIRPGDLAVFYPHPSYLPPWWRWAGALLLLATFSLLAIRVARRRPYLAVGWFWYLGTLVPMIGLVQAGAQAMADRYTYLPLTGIFLLLAWQAAACARGRFLRPLIAVVATAAVLVAAVATTAQVALWHDSVTLFRHALAAAPAVGTDPRPNPTMAFLHNLLGISLAKVGKTDEAVVQYRRALAVNPHYPDALNNLGRALDDQGLTDEAIPLYEQAAAGDSRSAEPRNNLGGALLARGRNEEAVLYLREAVALNPMHRSALNNLGVALASLGKTDAAEEAFRQAITVDPRYAIAHFNFGRFLLAQGRTEEAVRHFREARRGPEQLPAGPVPGQVRP